jgi:hypothetical protein
MAGPIRKDEFGALESLKRGPVKRDNDGADLAFQSLSSRGMAEKKGSNWLLTTAARSRCSAVSVRGDAARADRPAASPPAPSRAGGPGFPP